MSRRAAIFTQADVARALRAVEQVASGRWRVRITRDGEIIVEPVSKPADEAEADGEYLTGRGLPIVM